MSVSGRERVGLRAHSLHALPNVRVLLWTF